ncbi:MAG: hypothetical protein OXD47_05305 [Gammaproteobacteria bacterium]|nr:hypothetical protein [Gammaproteobacteria bacterium]
MSMIMFDDPTFIPATPICVWSMGTIETHDSLIAIIVQRQVIPDPVRPFRALLYRPPLIFRGGL